MFLTDLRILLFIQLAAKLLNLVFPCIMNFVNKIKILTTINLKYRRSTQITSPVFRFIHRFQAASSQRSQNDVITNLCEKLCCTEDIAKIIYIKFPSLRCVDAIRNDTLKWLRDRITLQSIAENPSLVTMDISKEMPVFFSFKFS